MFLHSKLVYTFSIWCCIPSEKFVQNLVLKIIEGKSRGFPSSLGSCMLYGENTDQCSIPIIANWKKWRIAKTVQVVIPLFHLLTHSAFILTYLHTTYSGRGEHGILGWIEWFRIDYIYQVFPWVFSIINQTEVFGHILALEGHIFSRMFTHSNLFTRWKLAFSFKNCRQVPAYNSSLKNLVHQKNKARNWFWQAQTLTWNSTKFR